MKILRWKRTQSPYFERQPIDTLQDLSGWNRFAMQLIGNRYSISKWEAGDWILISQQDTPEQAREVCCDYADRDGYTVLDDREINLL